MCRSSVNSRGAVAAAVLALLAPSALAGCDVGGLLSEAPPATCSESGARCQLRGGPLGVCEALPCPPGSAPPCFRCTPQH